MRFRATVSEITTFAHIVQSISKLSKKCILKFTPEHMHLICDDGCTDGGSDVQVWSQVQTDSLFSHYRIESNQANTIHLTTSVSALLLVLRSAEAHQNKDRGDIVLKLAKRPVPSPNAQGGTVLKPMLVWEIGGDAQLGLPPPLAHELHIKVLKTEDIERLKEPLCPTPDVHIVLPPLSDIRTVVDHLSRLSSNRILVSANAQGILRLETGEGDTLGVEVTTEWKGLLNPTISNAEESQEPNSTALEHPERFHVSAIAVKSLVRFLTASCIKGSTIAALCSGHSLIMYLYLGDLNSPGGCLTFFLPAVDVE